MTTQTHHSKRKTQNNILPKQAAPKNINPINNDSYHNELIASMFKMKQLQSVDTRISMQ